ncbi:MAG: tyrosine-type recombinase/integrase [Verrucomicrobiia bacterium]
MSTKRPKKPWALKLVGPNLYRSTTGAYYSLFKRGGKQIRRRLKTKDYKLAKRRLRTQEAKVERLTGSAVERKMLFEDLTTLWLASIKPHLKASSYGRRETALNGLSPFFKGRTVRNIGRQEIAVWEAKRGAELSPRSWNIEIETLRLVFNHAKDVLNILLDNPAAHLKRRRARKTEIVFPSREQFRLLLHAMRTGHKAGESADFVEFLAYSGCRKEEGVQMLWRDVDWERGTLRVTGGKLGTKNHEERTLPLFAPLRRFLETLRAARPSATPDDRLFKIESARTALHTACTKLGLPDYGHHAMRHFFATNCIEEGIDFKVIAGWLGHKDGGVLVASTYGHLRKEHNDAMAKRVTFDAAAPAEPPTPKVPSFPLHAVA